jgi:hypothetical protein
MKRGTSLARKTLMRQISAKKKARRATDEGKADKEHMGLVARLPCVICGFWPVQVHHVIHGRYSARRSSDRHTIPLCFPHHAELHAGKESWAAKWGPDYGYLPHVTAQVETMKTPAPNERSGAVMRGKNE